MARAKLIVALLMGILALGSQAQPATRPARGGEGSQSFPRVRVLLDDLKLSDDQKKKIDDVFNTTSQNLRTMLPEMRNMTQQERMEKYKQILTDLRDDIDQVLTPDQKKKFNESMEAVRSGFAGTPGPTTQPGAGGGSPGTALMMRIRSKLETLGLSDDQKQKVKKLLEDTGEKFKQITSSTERGSQEMRDKVRDLFEKTRDSLKEILTPDQFEKFSSGLRESFGGGDKPATQPRMIEEKMKDEKTGDDKSPAKDDDKKSSDKNDQSGEAPAGAPQTGQAAPAFALQKVDGGPLQLSAFKGKVVVLTFASYSSPTFRRRAAGLEDIRKHDDNRANFLFVYTKEAHPKGGWEVDRNKDEDVQVEQAKDLSDREKEAKRMHEALHFSWPLLVDSMDDATAKAYGAGECTTVIINRDGTIYSRLQWSDPYTLKRQLDELFSKKES